MWDELTCDPKGRLTIISSTTLPIGQPGCWGSFPGLHWCRRPLMITISTIRTNSCNYCLFSILIPTKLCFLGRACQTKFSQQGLVKALWLRWSQNFSGCLPVILTNRSIFEDKVCCGQRETMPRQWQISEMIVHATTDPTLPLSGQGLSHGPHKILHLHSALTHRPRPSFALGLALHLRPRWRNNWLQICRVKMSETELLDTKS